MPEPEPEPERLIAGFHDMAVMRKTIEQRSGHLGVAKDARPFGEGQGGRDHHAGVLVEFRQQGPAGLAERQVTQLIENHQIHAQQPQGNPSGFAGGLLLLKGVDQIDLREEANPLAVMGDARDAQRRGKMGLESPRLQ